MIDQSLKQYIEERIIPQYDAFDRGHNRTHVQRVIDESLFLARDYDVDENKVYAIAAYHDVGMLRGRELHHIYSGEVLMNDANLLQWFSSDDLAEMRDAIEDHRASGEHEPRTIYGRIVAEADRDIEPLEILRRTIQFGLKKYPQEPRNFHIQRAIEHMHEKYAEGGYLKLYLHSSKNEKGLTDLRQIIADDPKLTTLFNQIYDEEIEK